MSWEGPERRAADVVLSSVYDSMQELKENQHRICERLDSIEKSVQMAEGAWWITRYVIGPVVLSSAGLIAYLLGPLEKHLKGS